jgi:predicted GIY-YIG superfamily endonuclease
MGQLYILRLRGKKWYVGYTDRGTSERIHEHIDKKGAKWTKKHPPLKKGYLHSFSEPGKSKKDEDKKTLELMEEHGINNVRGGSWCMVNLYPEVYEELESLIYKSSKRSKKLFCDRCGRDSHERTECRATTTVDRVKITTKFLIFRPVTKSRKTKKKVVSKKTTTKKKATAKKDKKVICLRCNRVGHASKDCYAKTRSVGTGPFIDIRRKGLKKK